MAAVSQERKFSPENLPRTTRQQPASTLRAEDCRIVIGVDEAGYGPNIGPLLIAGSAWRIPREMDEQGFVAALAACFKTLPWSENCQHVPLGDSKQLYSSTTGLRTLEAGLMAMLAQLPIWANCACFRSLLTAIDHHGPLWSQTGNDQRHAWYADMDSDLTLHNTSEEIQRLAEIARAQLEQRGIELLATRSRVVFESNFNELVSRLGSKGRLLSTLTMELVCALLEGHDAQRIEVFCDRQGGRKKYNCVLLEAMPDEWFDTLVEANERSSYRRQRQPDLTIHFSVGGDSFPPTALASMTAKYLRERLMAHINAYWQAHVKDLVPTAGYPQDAKRFRAKIEDQAQLLGHPLEHWWRSC